MNGIYEISDMGSIRNIQTAKYLTGGINSDGYYTVVLSNNGKTKSYKVHRLVAEHFTRKPRIEVNHKNGIKTDNRAENLEFVTQHENILHAWANGICKRKYGNYGNRAIKIVQIDKKTMKKINEFNSEWEASEKTGNSFTAINNCLRGRSKSCGGYKWEYAD